ncbi:hypothetical protein TNIN_21161 [Trichonephila inaurata madagascariensis]|uniref:Uncharacterized protein n=1 Tax=Trichonephila inaurata madagascariensis TaxID=2747483 RepID=A0A8X6YID0_9ARAC|nr:hypothetical protein TNIN_21161 [Trichonephila inaurata madagascariensis]
MEHYQGREGRVKNDVKYEKSRLWTLIRPEADESRRKSLLMFGIVKSSLITELFGSKRWKVALLSFADNFPIFFLLLISSDLYDRNSLSALRFPSCVGVANCHEAARKL